MKGLSSAFTEQLWILHNESGIFIWLKSLLQHELMVDEQLTWPSAAKRSLEMICSTMCHLFLFHLCKHWWVQGFACNNFHSGCCSDKSGHLWDRRDYGYSVSSSINGVRLLHACLLSSLTQRQVSPTTQQLTNNSPPQVFTAFSLSGYWQQIHQLKSTRSSEDDTGREKLALCGLVNYLHESFNQSKCIC